MVRACLVGGVRGGHTYLVIFFFFQVGDPRLAFVGEGPWWANLPFASLSDVLS